jgi:hypothetical protein
VVVFVGDFCCGIRALLPSLAERLQDQAIDGGKNQDLSRQPGCHFLMVENIYSEKRVPFLAFEAQGKREEEVVT